MLAVTNDSNAEDTVVVPVSGQYVVQLVVSEVMTVTPVVTSVLLHKLSEHEVTVITVVDWSKLCILNQMMFHLLKLSVLR